MNQIPCLYPNRHDVIVAYLYDDIDAAERVAFETHVTTCLPCRSELAELRGVRSRLAEWAAPELSRPFGFSSPEPRVPSLESRAWWHTVPVWAQVAAAMLVLGVSASIANLDVRYGRDGLDIRTGWSKPATPVAPADAASWRAELAAVQTQLRSEMRTQAASVSATSTPAAGATITDAEFGRRVRVFIAESERKQQNELALRLAQLQTDMNALLQADRSRFNQAFREVTNTYGGQIMKQQQQINYLLPASQR